MVNTLFVIDYSFWTISNIQTKSGDQHDCDNLNSINFFNFEICVILGIYPTGILIGGLILGVVFIPMLI
jgi:hypothetical protein